MLLNVPLILTTPTTDSLTNQSSVVKVSKTTAKT